MRGTLGIGSTEPEHGSNVRIRYAVGIVVVIRKCLKKRGGVSRGWRRQERTASFFYYVKEEAGIEASSRN